MNENGHNPAKGAESGDMILETPSTGIESVGNVITSTQSELPVPKSMANRNKKKGFLKEMVNVQSTRTVFGDDAQGSSTPLKNHKGTITADTTMSSTPNQSSSQVQSRVIPPSELEVLPSNVFVTHVEYQRKGWTPRQRNQRTGHNETHDTSRKEDETEITADEDDGVDEEEQTNGFTTAAGEDSAIERADQQDVTEEDIWTIADTRFGDLPILATERVLREGSILAWKVCHHYCNSQGSIPAC